MKSGLLTNASELVTCRAEGSQGDVHSIPLGAVAWHDGKIVWVGASEEVPDVYADYSRFDARGRLVVPGLVDCHTHLAFGGWRADEFSERAKGTSYQEIARKGGGILRTVEQTRNADEESLLDHARSFMWKMIKLGVTTIECKSGYGLTLSDELKLLRVYDALRAEGPARIVSTFMGAHTVPKEFRGNRDRYVDLVCHEMLPAVAAANLATFCDAFVEEGAFTHVEARRIFEKAATLGLRPKLHVDQLAESGGAQLAVDVNAVSADHLEYISDNGIRALAGSTVTPVALPIASLYLRQPALDARRLLDSGIDVAVATDFNPGSAPTYHLPLAMTLASTMNRMTPSESLKAATLVAARAVGKEEEVGSIEIGKDADFVLLEAPSVEHWIYQFAPARTEATVVGGVPVWIAETFAR